MKSTLSNLIISSLCRYNYDEYNYELHADFYRMFINDCKKRKVKALVVGYPLKEGNKTTPMCHFVESFVNFMMDNGVFTRPVTLINEFRTTKEAALKILRQNQRTPDQYFLGSMEDSLQQKGELFGEYFKTEL